MDIGLRIKENKPFGDLSVPQLLHPRNGNNSYSTGMLCRRKGDNVGQLPSACSGFNSPLTSDICHYNCYVHLPSPPSCPGSHHSHCSPTLSQTVTSLLETAFLRGFWAMGILIWLVGSDMCTGPWSQREMSTGQLKRALDKKSTGLGFSYDPHDLGQVHYLPKSPESSSVKWI